MIASSIVGKGEPILLLHGLFGDKDNLRSVANYLKKDFCVHSLDLPNHGDSSHVNHMDFNLFSQAVADYVDAHFSKQQSLRLLGHSLGGKTLMRYACCHPERVKQLIVVDIAPKINKNRVQEILLGLQAVDLAKIESRQSADAVLVEYVAFVSIRQFLLKSLIRTNQGFQWKFNLSAILQNQSQWLAAGIEASDQFLGTVHFIKGGLSAYIEADDWPLILKHFPKATLHEIEGSGHWLHAEQPKRFKACLEALLLVEPL